MNMPQDADPAPDQIDTYVVPQAQNKMKIFQLSTKPDGSISTTSFVCKRGYYETLKREGKLNN